MNFQRKKDEINTPTTLNKINYSSKQNLFMINLIKVIKEDFSLIRMIFFTIKMFKNDIGRFFSTEFSTNFDFYSLICIKVTWVLLLLLKVHILAYQKQFRLFPNIFCKSWDSKTKYGKIGFGTRTLEKKF